jgi:hypothetical protein
MMADYLRENSSGIRPEIGVGFLNDGMLPS